MRGDVGGKMLPAVRGQSKGTGRGRASYGGNAPDTQQEHKAAGLWSFMMHMRDSKRTYTNTDIQELWRMKMHMHGLSAASCRQSAVMKLSASKHRWVQQHKGATGRRGCGYHIIYP